MIRYRNLFLVALALSTFSVVSGWAQGQSTQPVTHAPVTVAFYNLKNYLAMDRRVSGDYVEDAPKPESEIRHIVEALQSINPDILGVCEIGSPEYLEDIRSRLDRVGVSLPHTELVRASSGFDRNLAILSRYPISSSQSRSDYSYRLEGRTFPVQRGILDVNLTIHSNYDLRVILLHLKSKREVEEADQAEMRFNEAHLARKHIDRIFEKTPDANVLVMGDLNDHRHEAPVKAIQGYFASPGYLSPIALSDDYGFRWTHHWEYADSYSRFDYALASRGITGEIDRNRSYIHHWSNWDKASDHRPLVLSLIPVDR